MADQLAAPGSEEARGLETYPIGYEPKTVEFFARRTAARHAAFFLPYLEAGLSLLDGGCGPGTITADLARLVAPGEVIGSISSRAKSLRRAPMPWPEVSRTSASRSLTSTP